LDFGGFAVYTKSSGIERPISHYLEGGLRLTQLGRNAQRLFEKQEPRENLRKGEELCQFETTIQTTAVAAEGAIWKTDLARRHRAERSWCLERHQRAMCVTRECPFDSASPLRKRKW